MSVPYCEECGDRVVFTVPNEEFKKLVLENGYHNSSGSTRFVEIGYAFVLTVLSDEGEKNIFGERGDAVHFNPTSEEWSVVWKA